MFDVDGVLARGSTPLAAAQEAIRLLEDGDGRLKVPVAFVTNACNRSHDKAAQIQKWLGIQVLKLKQYKTLTVKYYCYLLFDDTFHSLKPPEHGLGINMRKNLNYI